MEKSSFFMGLIIGILATIVFIQNRFLINSFSQGTNASSPSSASEVNQLMPSSVAIFEYGGMGASPVSSPTITQYVSTGYVNPSPGGASPLPTPSLNTSPPPTYNNPPSSSSSPPPTYYNPPGGGGGKIYIM